MGNIYKAYLIDLLYLILMSIAVFIGIVIIYGYNNDKLLTIGAISITVTYILNTLSEIYYIDSNITIGCRKISIKLVNMDQKNPNTIKYLYIII